MTLSTSAIRFLAWIRDNQHHQFAWVMRRETDPPSRWFHLRLSGHRASIKIHRDVLTEAGSLFNVAPDGADRVWWPNALGEVVLQEAGM
ncbi:MAG: hypothetical protein ACR2QF_02570 [Geminicoccaceae bacterium]